MSFLSVLLGWCGRVLSDAVARAFSDWRRDKALEAKGAAEADAKANAAAAEAERRAAAVPAATEDDTIGKLETGGF